MKITKSSHKMIGIKHRTCTNDLDVSLAKKEEKLYLFSAPKANQDKCSHTIEHSERLDSRAAYGENSPFEDLGRQSCCRTLPAGECPRLVQRVR